MASTLTLKASAQMSAMLTSSLSANYRLSWKTMESFFPLIIMYLQIIPPFFKADYKDADSITEGYAPYLMIADEAGLFDADSQNNIHPLAAMTREDLAIAIYAFMDR